MKRKRRSTAQRVIYTERDDEDEDDDDYNKKKKKEEDYAQTDDEQPGPSDQTHNKGTPVNKNKLWDVTCGDKQGFLDTEKLAIGEDCIRCDGSWFSPSKFEDLGGKGSSKKWKSTIFHKDKPLQYYLDRGIITVRGKKKTTKKSPKPKRFSESESSTEESPEDTEEEDDDEDDDWLPNSEELVQEAEEGEEKRVEAEDEEAVEIDKNGESDSEMGEREAGEPKLNIPPHEKSLLKEVSVVIERLPEAMSDHQPSCREHPLADNLHDCGEAQSEEQSEPNTLEIPDLSVKPDTHEDPSQMSGPHIAGEELIQNLKQCGMKEHVDKSGSESSAAGNMSDVSTMTVPRLLRIKDERLRQLTENLGQGDATTSGHDAAPLEEMEHEATLSHTTEASDTVERPDFRPSANIDLDTMDLNQLKREKIKMQLKVLKLEQEYYTLKIRKLKKDNVITQGQSSFNS